jgi:hypothetical protein
MAEPSRVPSAPQLARYCDQKYQLEIGTTLPADAATDLEAQAEYFVGRDQLVQTFSRSKVGVSSDMYGRRR